MKSCLIILALLCAVTLSTSLTPSVSNAANAEQKEKAVTSFTQPVQIMGVTLKGEYLFVHDDAAMARGESCTYIYKGRAENINNLVISFHCMPVVRARASYFTVRTLEIFPGYSEIREFQFGGSSEAHLVPLNHHAGHVTISNY